MKTEPSRTASFAALQAAVYCTKYNLPQVTPADGNNLFQHSDTTDFEKVKHSETAH